jgi:hypothetical protein
MLTLQTYTPIMEVFSRKKNIKPPANEEKETNNKTKPAN